MFSRNANLSVLYFVLDFFSIIAAVFLATFARLYLPVGIPLAEIPWQTNLLLAALFVYSLVFLALAVYTPDISTSLNEEMLSLGTGCILAGLSLTGMLYFTVRETSRLYLVEFFLIHIILVFAWRIIFQATKKVFGLQIIEPMRLLLAGSGENAVNTIEKLNGLHTTGLQLLGYLTPNAEPLPNIDIIPNLGNFSDAPRVVRDLDIHNLIIALPSKDHQQTETLVSSLVESPCNLWVVPDYYNLMIYGAQVRSLGALPMISLRAPTLTASQRLVKRLFDLLLGSIMLILFSPILLLVALAIRLESPGPIIFKQQRAGENGRLFGMFKFRSMVIDAEQRQKEVLHHDNNGKILYKDPEDPRITQIGRIIRRMSIDELPQLFNVLRGDMSLVGPRPELPWLVAMYEPWQRKRFAVPQGMTGWWQVNGRSDKPMHLNTEYDIYYIQNYSLLLDLQIMVRTPWVILKGLGAF